VDYKDWDVSRAAACFWTNILAFTMIPVMDIAQTGKSTVDFSLQRELQQQLRGASAVAPSPAHTSRSAVGQSATPKLNAALGMQTE
jgi:hypothetical protein